MAYLVRSLVNLRAEIDAHWPHRDRRTDGWVADPRVRKSYGHNPDAKGAVHAIDVDKDGIDQMWLINTIYKGGGVLWYIIWNRRIYTRENNWKWQPYDGSNPHTDHLHIEVLRDYKAENYNGSWGIAQGRGGFGGTDSGNAPVAQTSDSAPPALTPWQYQGYITASASLGKQHANGLLYYRDAFRRLRT